MEYIGANCTSISTFLFENAVKKNWGGGNEAE